MTRHPANTPGNPPPAVPGSYPYLGASVRSGVVTIVGGQLDGDRVVLVTLTPADGRQLAALLAERYPPAAPPPP